MNKLHIKLFGIKGVRWAGEARSISVNAVDGRMGILLNHIETACQLIPGEILIDGRVACNVNKHGGFIHVKQNNVFVFVD